MKVLENEKIINDVIRKYGLDPGDNFQYFGGSILNETTYPDYIKCQYCVDGYFDSDGEPYILEDIMPNMPHTKRLLVFFKENGDNIIVPVDGKSWEAVGASIPDYVKGISFDKSNYIFTSAQH